VIPIQDLLFENEEPMNYLYMGNSPGRYPEPPQTHQSRTKNLTQYNHLFFPAHILLVVLLESPRVLLLITRAHTPSITGVVRKRTLPEFSGPFLQSERTRQLLSEHIFSPRGSPRVTAPHSSRALLLWLTTRVHFFTL